MDGVDLLFLVLLTVVAVAVSLIVTSTTSSWTAKAQSTNAPTQNWFITRRGSEINVIDTGGVCLYVIKGGYGASGIAAIPKTQLPAGEGCE